MILAVSESVTQNLNMVSYHIGLRIRLEEAARAFVDRVVEKFKSDLCLRLGHGTVHVFSFGSVVFTDVESAQIEVFLQDVGQYVEEPCARVHDDLALEIDPNAREKVYFERVVLQETSLEKVRLLGLVLAQSTTLEHFEEQVELLLDRAANFTESIAKGGSWRGPAKEMMALLGQGLNTRRHLVSNLAILDAPEIVWEDPALDDLYQEHRANFELSNRYRTMEQKLRLMHESIELLVDLNHTRQTHVLELVIIALIAVEVVMAFIGRAH